MGLEQSADARVPVWSVGALCHAVGDILEARFNPVAVAGEISSFSRAASGHCYFSLKDSDGQLRCAMFRRAAGLLDFSPRDGDRVEVRGRLAVYEPRGDLQLIVESLRRSGDGSLYEQFARLKARLAAEGLFDADRKRPLPRLPRRIGVVTSLGAAALHDVVTALRRRVPHLPVVIAPAAVQGPGAPAELVRALRALAATNPPVDLILLVRGGGSIEDLWAFNDEALAREIVRSPVPIVCGVGHETDFTIADFCADLRAPTPTAAAELAAPSRDAALEQLERGEARLRRLLQAALDGAQQRLDLAAGRLARPSALAARQRMALAHRAQQLHHAVLAHLQQMRHRQATVEAGWSAAERVAPQRERERLDLLERRLRLLDPALVLQRGYAWLSAPDGRTLTHAADIQAGDRLRAQLQDGTVDASALGVRSSGERPTA